jgi:hypothetical protein
MRNFNFTSASGALQASTVTTLVANAAAVTVAQFPVRGLTKLIPSVGVAAAALTGLTFYGRGDTNAAWMPISTTMMMAYGCSDATSDITKTAAGQSAIAYLDVTMWSDVMVTAASAGAAVVTVTAGFAV